MLGSDSRIQQTLLFLPLISSLPIVLSFDGDTLESVSFLKIIEEGNWSTVYQHFFLKSVASLIILCHLKNSKKWSDSAFYRQIHVWNSIKKKFIVYLIRQGSVSEMGTTKHHEGHWTHRHLSTQDGWMTSNTYHFVTYSPRGSLSFLSSYQSSLLQIMGFAWELICRLKIEGCTFHDKLVHSRLPGELEFTETNSGFLYLKEALQLPGRATRLSDLR